MQRMLINQHSFIFNTYKKIEKYFFHFTNQKLMLI